MKKIILMVLSAMLLLSLAACGGGKDAPDAETQNVPQGTETEAPEVTDLPEELAVGETIVTEQVEVVLNWVESGKQLDGSFAGETFLMTPDEAVTQKVVHSNDETKALVSFSISAANLGKETCTFCLDDLLTLDYNDGYKFESDQMYTFIQGQWMLCSTGLELEPLSGQTEFRGVISVPMEVIENTDLPLKALVNIEVREGDADAQQVVYVVR